MTRDATKRRHYNAEDRAPWSDCPNAARELTHAEAHELLRTLCGQPTVRAQFPDRSARVGALLRATKARRQSDMARASWHEVVIESCHDTLPAWVWVHELVHLLIAKAEHDRVFRHAQLRLTRAAFGRKAERLLREAFRAANLKYRPYRSLSPERAAKARGNLRTAAKEAP